MTRQYYYAGISRICVNFNKIQVTTLAISQLTFEAVPRIRSEKQLFWKFLENSQENINVGDPFL